MSAAEAAKQQPNNTVCPGKMELRGGEGVKIAGWLAGWQATVSGTEEQSAGQIEANAVRHRVFLDV